MGVLGETNAVGQTLRVSTRDRVRAHSCLKGKTRGFWQHCNEQRARVSQRVIKETTDSPDGALRDKKKFENIYNNDHSIFSWLG